MVDKEIETLACEHVRDGATAIAALHIGEKGRLLVCAACATPVIRTILMDAALVLASGLVRAYTNNAERDKKQAEAKAEQKPVEYPTKEA